MRLRLLEDRPRIDLLLVLPPGNDVFRNGTPVSNPWFVASLLNVLIYLIAMMTGYAIADWINDDE